MTQPLWTPSPERVAQTNLSRFIDFVNRRHQLSVTGYDDLYAWSIDSSPDFWESVWRFAEIRHSAPYQSVLENPVMPGTKWFEGARLNFAENLLRYRDDQHGHRLCSAKEARSRRTAELMPSCTERVARLAAVPSAGWGSRRGDRVVGFMPNLPEDHPGHAGRVQHRGRLVLLLARTSASTA